MTLSPRHKECVCLTFSKIYSVVVLKKSYAVLTLSSSKSMRLSRPSLPVAMQSSPHIPTNSKRKLADGATLDDILPEAFAVVREASKRINNQRHFDVQLIGGITLHSGRIAEMKTGEGKTLVCHAPTLPECAFG